MIPFVWANDFNSTFSSEDSKKAEPQECLSLTFSHPSVRVGYSVEERISFLFRHTAKLLMKFETALVALGR
jgi:hypothetical protein